MSEIVQELKLDERTKKLIYEELPRIFQQNPLLKYVVWDICSDKFADKKTTESRFELLLEELRRERERSDQRFEKYDQRFEKFEKRFEKYDRRFEEFGKRFEKYDRRFEEFEKRFEKYDQRFEKFEKRFEKYDQRFEKFERRFEELQEELRRERERSDRRFEEMQKEIKLLAEKIVAVDRRIDRTIGALGARWGLSSEKAFRDAIRGILGELTNYKIEHFKGYDNQGTVFGRPDQIELDVVIRNGQIWLIEIKSSVSKADVYIFQRKVEFYEREKKVKVDRKIIISPMVENAAMDLARALGITVYSQPEDIEI